MFDLNGKTALITGASSGIGRDIARVLAREVGTLVLVARRKARLDELAGELIATHPSLRVHVRPTDLEDRNAVAAMLDLLTRDGIVIDVLINNAGLGLFSAFAKSDWEATA